MAARLSTLILGDAGWTGAGCGRRVCDDDDDGGGGGGGDDAAAAADAGDSDDDSDDERDSAGNDDDDDDDGGKTGTAGGNGSCANNDDTAGDTGVGGALFDSSDHYANCPARCDAGDGCGDDGEPRTSRKPAASRCSTAGTNTLL